MIAAAPSTRIPGLAITAGGLAWLAKFASILASGGQETVSGAPALLYDAGLLLLVGGAVGIALHLTRRNALVARIAASLLAPPAFFATFLLLDFLVQLGIPDGWPDYVRDEAGILVTAAVWLVTGLALVFRKRREVP